MLRTLFVSTVVAALSIGALSLPTANLNARSGGVDDLTILNYALTLEHLENAFYRDALAKFDAQAFDDAGMPSFARGRFLQIAQHEREHVDFLSKALGEKATQPCEYSFPYTDPKSFAALSSVIEGVGTSAYLGAAPFVDNKDYLTVAGAILTVEARHAAWISAAVNKVGAWSGSFDTPLGFNEVYTIAAGFITSCPSSNPTLPVHAFPGLTIENSAPGKVASVASKATADNAPTHICFLTGLDKIFVPIDNGQVVIPEGMSGQVYAVATKSDKEATDDTIVAGPAILLYPRDSRGNLVR